MHVKIDDDLSLDDAVALASLASILKNKKEYPHASEVVQAAKLFLMMYPTTSGPFEVKKKKVG